MSSIDFISHESFPEDEYIKEIVYICLEQKYRVAYVRKSSKNGGLFWSVMSCGMTKNGKKEYFDSFIQDSNFLEKDIRHFLETRSWEGRSAHRPLSSQNQAEQPRSMSEVAEMQDVPF